eukprot:gene63692-87112_t
MSNNTRPSGWFAGNELTAADIIMSFPLEAAAARGGASQGYPNILSFLARIKARAAHDQAAASLRFAATHVLSLTFFPRWLVGMEARLQMGAIQT